MNTSLKSLFIIILISFGYVNSFSQTDSTKTVIKEKKVYSEISNTGNYKLKATTKVKPNSSFELKINKKLNTSSIDKNLDQNKSTQNHNFLLEELPENKDIIGKKYWKGKDVTIKIRPIVSWAGSIKTEKQKFDNTDRFPCTNVLKNMAIYFDGKVPICPMDYDAATLFGDVSKNSIEEVWTQSLKPIRKLHLESRWEELPPFCYNCRDWQGIRAEYIQNEDIKH